MVLAKLGLYFVRYVLQILLAGYTYHHIYLLKNYIHTSLTLFYFQYFLAVTSPFHWIVYRKYYRNAYILVEKNSLRFPLSFIKGALIGAVKVITHHLNKNELFSQIYSLGLYKVSIDASNAFELTESTRPTTNTFELFELSEYNRLQTQQLLYTCVVLVSALYLKITMLPYTGCFQYKTINKITTNYREITLIQ